jgi:hypothetical protein
MAEVEIGVLSSQCLDRRIPDIETLEQETAACVADRNAARATVSWHFTVHDARSKLDHLYPATS